jgi:hypothetical protein
MLGKQKCRILREIRKEIAKNNDIEYVTAECTFKGNCRGTCPKCESEDLYLERELEKRRNLAKTVTLAGISALMTLFAACDNETIKQAENAITESPTATATATATAVHTEKAEYTDVPTEIFSAEPTDGLMGGIITPTATPEPTDVPTDSPDFDEIMGDIALPIDPTEMPGEIAGMPLPEDPAW